MIKNLFFTFLLLLALSVNSYSAGSGGDNSKTKTNYDKAVAQIKLAKMYEKKTKLKKQIKSMKKLKNY